jgi:hypothetical protein
LLLRLETRQARVAAPGLDLFQQLRTKRHPHQPSSVSSRSVGAVWSGNGLDGFGVSSKPLILSQFITHVEVLLDVLHRQAHATVEAFANGIEPHCGRSFLIVDDFVQFVAAPRNILLKFLDGLCSECLCYGLQNASAMASAGRAEISSR